MTDDAGNPSTSDSGGEWSYLWNRRVALRTRTLMNRLYQQERRRIMEGREGAVKAASLVSGSVAVARVVDPTTLYVCLAVIFVGTAGSLVFGWGAKARDAAERCSKWIMLDRDIEQVGERAFTESNLDEWTARCNEIEATEPAPNLVLLEACLLRACGALGITPDPKRPIPRAVGWRIPLMIH